MPHMMDVPLLLSTLYERSVRLFPDQEIVSVESDRSPTRRTYGSTDVRVRKLATALAERLGVDKGEPVGTFAWNNGRHHELYWATANTGRICHTLNIRLFPEQITYIVNHARDRVVFVDPDLVELIEQVAGDLTTVEHFVVMDDSVGDTTLPNAIAYEDLIADATPWGRWPELDERSPMMFCYTSGTTGHPKGVAYTQRSTYLHAMGNLVMFPLSSADNVMPVVPMFHASSWGLPFTSTVVGAKLTYPGPDLGAEALVRLITTESVTYSPGVPTVWLGVQQYLIDHPEATLPSVRALMCGGSAVPRGLIDWFWNNHQIPILQAWGMTETNPVATMAILKPGMEDWDFERKLDVMETAGLPIPGLEVKIVDDAGERLPEDGDAFGELLIRGPWIAAEYYEDARSPETFVDGWMRTGDVCKITPGGYVRITDRAKDVIKSGGEWISSVDLENALMAHPEVVEAMVVGVEHPRWQERPLAFVVLRADAEESEDGLMEFLAGKVAKWWLPDRMYFLDELPKTGTGKFDKKVLRERYADALLGEE